MKKRNLVKSITCTSLLTLAGSAFGHGLIVDPPARNALCGLNEKADQAVTPACVQAAEADANGLYQFMSVLTHDIGRMGGPSTHVCGFDSETWQGGATPWDLPLDWPTTPISSGEQTFTWDISWGPHYDDTEEFRYWITKPGFNYQVGTALSWDDFEQSPFCVLSYDDTAPNASPDVIAEKSSSLFHTTCDVPARSGRHVIYGEWGRNYFTYERFHGCVDVEFNGTGNASSPSTAPSSSSSVSSSSAVAVSSSSSSSVPSSVVSSSSSSSSFSSSSSSLVSSVASSSSSSAAPLSSSSSSELASSSSVAPAGGTGLLCDYVIVNEWNNGFVADIRLTNTSDEIIENWDVQWSYSDGSSVNYLWNANIEGSNPYSASGVQWNRSILPGQTVVFGMSGNKGVEPAQAVTVNGEYCN